MEKDQITHSESAVATPTVKQRLGAHLKKYWWLHLIIFSIGVLLVALPLVYVGYPNIAQGIVNGAQIDLVNQAFVNPTPNTVGFQLNASINVNTIFRARLDSFTASLYNHGSDVELFNFTVPGFTSENGAPITVNQTVTISNADAFNKFTEAGLAQKTLQVDLRGRGGLKLGALPHIYVYYSKTISLNGLDGLQQLETTDLTVISGNATLPFDANTNGTVIINNVSPLSLTLGDTSFNLFVKDQSLGTAIVPNLVLAPGNNSYPIYLNTTIGTALNLIQNGYPCAVLPVTVAGTGAVYNGQEIPYWQAALSSNNISTSVNITSALASLGLASTLISKNCTS